MFSVLYPDPECSPIISGLQDFICSLAVFVHMSPQSHGMPRCNLGGGGLWIRAAAGVSWTAPHV